MFWLARRKFQSLIEGGQNWLWPLAPLSWVWGSVVFFRNLYYDCIRPKKVDAVVVSVGNIEVGGTGKTPLVLHLAEIFRHRKVAILSRGYGTIPDEALLMAKRLPQTRVYIGKDRIKTAQLAVQEGAELLILDDGLQYRKLYRDFDLALVTGKKERYLPWGRLRDSPKRLKNTQIMHHKLVFKKIVDAQGRQLSSIEGKKIAYFCGIARPDRFKKTLIDLGAHIVDEYILADHEPVKLSHLQKLAEKAPLILTTEKDFIKLAQHSLPIYYLEMGAQITSDISEWETLVEKIDQKIDNKTHL